LLSSTAAVLLQQSVKYLQFERLGRSKAHYSLQRADQQATCSCHHVQGQHILTATLTTRAAEHAVFARQCKQARQHGLLRVKKFSFSMTTGTNH
jgi:hypothetical protein